LGCQDGEEKRFLRTLKEDNTTSQGDLEREKGLQKKGSLVKGGGKSWGGQHDSKLGWRYNPTQNNSIRSLEAAEKKKKTRKPWVHRIRVTGQWVRNCTLRDSEERKSEKRNHRGPELKRGKTRHEEKKNESGGRIA